MPINNNLTHIVRPLSVESIHKIVFMLRKKFDLENIIKFPIVEFIELLLPRLIPDFELQICSIVEMGNINGQTFPDKHIIRIREDIYEGAIHGNTRDRMTLAHEVGHLFLHAHQDVGMCRVADQRRIAAYISSEWQANTFAGQLLAPLIYCGVKLRKKYRIYSIFHIQLPVFSEEEPNLSVDQKNVFRFHEFPILF